MSVLLSLSYSGGGDGGGGGGGGCGMFWLFLCAELLWIELPFLLVVLFVISSPTSSRSGSTSPVDVQLQLFVYRFDCSIFSKAIFGRGVLLHVSGQVSGYFGWRVTLEA